MDQVTTAEAAAKEKTALEKQVETLQKELRDKVLNPYANPRTPCAGWDPLLAEAGCPARNPKP